jgi:hypothetical protein
MRGLPQAARASISAAARRAADGDKRLHAPSVEDRAVSAPSACSFRKALTEH